MIIIEKSDPREAQITALLEASHALMKSLFPAEDNHFLSIEALCTPDIHFFAAREDDQVLGTGALVLKGDYGEIKSMFTAPDARGKGIAAALLRQLEDEARALGLSRLKLETGSLLHAAHRLYKRAGFSRCTVFGEYHDNDTSIFMEKSL